MWSINICRMTHEFALLFHYIHLLAYGLDSEGKTRIYPPNQALPLVPAHRHANQVVYEHQHANLGGSFEAIMILEAYAGISLKQRVSLLRQWLQPTEYLSTGSK